MILLGRSRHSRLPAGLGFSRLEARILVATDLARKCIFSVLRVPPAQIGLFHRGLSFMGARFAERGSR